MTFSGEDPGRVVAGAGVSVHPEHRRRSSAVETSRLTTATCGVSRSRAGRS